MNTKSDPIHCVAIDVSKSTLQVQDDQRAFAVGNHPSGHRTLLDHLITCINPLVVFETSGGYERILLQSLQRAGMPLAMVNPARVREFARSKGVRVKTDPFDAK